MYPYRMFTSKRSCSKRSIRLYFKYRFVFFSIQLLIMYFDKLTIFIQQLIIKGNVFDIYQSSLCINLFSRC
nr:MAG TPA_asm: GidA associated domain [Bacteriophage sp.]